MFGVHYNIKDTSQTTHTRVSADLNGSVTLKCPLQSLDSSKISWIRERDLHILSVGQYMYITDKRFDIDLNEVLGTWSLIITRLQRMDSGNYICQISAESLHIHTVHLYINPAFNNLIKTDNSFTENPIRVPEAVVRIIGPKQRIYSAGRKFNLTCVVEIKNFYEQQATATPGDNYSKLSVNDRSIGPVSEPLVWSFNNEVLRTDSLPSHVRIMLPKTTSQSAVAVSALEVLSSHLSDSGVYSCRTLHTSLRHYTTASVSVLIVDDESISIARPASNQEVYILFLLVTLTKWLLLFSC